MVKTRKKKRQGKNFKKMKRIVFRIEDVFTREEREERVNKLLIFATLALSLILLCFMVKLLLVLPSTESKILTYHLTEGEFKLNG